MTRKAPLYLPVGWGVMTLALCQPARAQAASDGPTAVLPQTVGELIVTARKRSESAQSIPVSVAVVNGALMAQEGIKDLFQAVTLVPGVVFSRAPDDGLALTFRGLGTPARPQAFEQSVALFTDGVFLGKSRLYSTGLFDLDRLEFIKGTQSTLLGKNASLGAISLVSRQPGGQPSFEGRAGYEAIDGGYTLDAAGTAPLGDRISIRLAAHYSDLDGWVHNDVTDHNGPEHKDLGLRATIRARVTSSLTVTAAYQHADNQQIGASYQLIGNIPSSYGEGALDDRTSQFTGQTPSGDTYHRTHSDIAYIRAEQGLGPLTLTSQSSYVQYSLFNQDDFDFSKDDTVNFRRSEDYRQFTQEIRLQSPGDQTVSYMVGAFFLDSAWDSIEDQLWAVPGFPPAGGPPPGQLFNGPFENDFHQDSRAYSAFASAMWSVTERLRLSGGARVTREEKDVLFGRKNAAPFTVWNTVANPPFDPTPLFHNSNFYDGNVSLQYNITPELMTYASFGHGGKSGGFVETNTIAVPPSDLVDGKVPAALVAAGSEIKDETTETYEIGLKSTSLEGRFLLNVVGFWTDIQNFQDTVFTGGALGFLTYNDPARSRGFEVDSAFRLTPELRLDGGLTYADATAVIQPIDPATNTPEVDASGNPIFKRYRQSQAPRVIFNVGATYGRSISDGLDLQLGVELRYRGGMYNQRQNEFYADPLETLDLTLGIESKDKRWGVDLVARNVGNAISQDFASPSVDPRFAAFYGAYLAGPNALRTVLISAHVSY